MSGELVPTLGDDSPLCPNVLPPTSVLHQQHNRTLDAFYEAASLNEDSEMPPDVDKSYSAANATSRMRLYVDSASVYHRGQFLTVESWWWRCQLCGCILPAVARPRAAT